MGPDGRGGVGLADGSGVWLATSGEAAAGAVGADSLQAEIRSSEITRRQKMTELRRISKGLSSLILWRTKQPDCGHMLNLNHPLTPDAVKNKDRFLDTSQHSEIRRLGRAV